LTTSLLVSTCLAGTPALGETPVSLADLKGAVIHTRMRYDQEGFRNNVPFQNQSEIAQTITVESETSLKVSVTVTANTWRGVRSSAPSLGTVTLGVPREVRSAGGGHVLWLFEDGKFVVLRTFKAGGFRSTISFTRGARGLACTVHSAFARETGTANFRWTSPVVGSDIEMKRMTPISSSCTVSRD
jgi:hypothetical protein